MSVVEKSLKWPPQYTVKKNARARHVKLKTSVRNGLEVVVPQRFNVKNIPEILERNKAWIEKKLNEIRTALNDVQSKELPTEIFFPVTQQAWKIVYIKMDSNKIRVFSNPHHDIIVMGWIENKKLCQRALLAWTKEQAKIHLTALLKKISEQIQLPYKSCMIRAQQTRWGSCSSSKSISLNYKLIFLPTSLVQHIIIHELCHTIHMNHSPKFWRLVANFDPRWKEHNREVRRADKQIPVWVLAAY